MSVLVDARMAPERCGQAAAEALGGQIIAGAAKVARTTAAWVAMVGEFDARGAHHWMDMPTTAKWLELACSMNPTTAREHVRVGVYQGSWTVLLD